MRPDRIVIGSDDPEAVETMRRLYAPFERNHGKLLVMDVRSAELTKYAANAMLATRISFMNEMALLAERVGADIDAVRRGIGSDPRIGSHFLYAGCGYGGACFPKDLKAITHTARAHDMQLSLLETVHAINERQKLVLVDRVLSRFGPDLDQRKIALWGLAFKPGTDDMREAPSLIIVRELAKRHARIRAYDPVANRTAAHALGDVESLTIVSGAMAALEGADALVIATEWKEFRSPDFERMRSLMREPVIFDGRNIFDPAAASAAGFEYVGIGHSTGAGRYSTLEGD